MSGTRPSIFGNELDTDIDLSGFAPKGEREAPPITPNTLERISDEGGFPSRSPKPRTSSPPLSPRRPVAAKSGRTELLNARITRRAHDRFHEIVDNERLRYEAGELTHRVTLGEVVERALAALEREIGQGGRAQ